MESFYLQTLRAAPARAKAPALRDQPRADPGDPPAAGERL
jgi:hypothetical protein